MRIMYFVYKIILLNNFILIENIVSRRALLLLSEMNGVHYYVKRWAKVKSQLTEINSILACQVAQYCTVHLFHKINQNSKWEHYRILLTYLLSSRVYLFLRQMKNVSSEHSDMVTLHILKSTFS